MKQSRILTVTCLAALVAVFVSLSGCRKAVEPPNGSDTPAAGEPMIPSAAGVLSVKMISELGNAGDFEVDLFFTDSLGHAIQNVAPGILNIIAGLDTQFISKGTSQGVTAPCGPVSAELLIDQTNSMADNDPTNLRLAAAKVFLGGITLAGGGDEVQLSSFFSFAWGGLRSYGPFTPNGASLYPPVDKMAGDLGPWTPLYDAMWAESDSLATLAHNQNKVLVVFTDGDDNASTHSMWDAILHAKSLGIKVFAIALKPSGDTNTQVAPGANSALYLAAMQTGGSVMHTQNANELVSYYGGLRSLVHGNTPYVKTLWHVTLPKQSSIAGRTISATLKIGANVTAPFSVTF